MKLAPLDPRWTMETTCYAAPEIIEFYHDGEYRGYLRLRHGLLQICDDWDNLKFMRNFPLSDNADEDLTEIEFDLADTEVVDIDGVFSSDLQREVYTRIAVSELS